MEILVHFSPLARSRDRYDSFCYHIFSVFIFTMLSEKTNKDTIAIQFMFLNMNTFWPNGSG